MATFLPRWQWPKYLQKRKEITAIYCGGCLDPNDTDNVGKSNIPAHVHCYPDKKGIICLGYKYQLHNKNLILHELAHILDASELGAIRYHRDPWRKLVKELGGTIKSFKITSPSGKTIWTRNYEKRKRIEG